MKTKPYTVEVSITFQVKAPDPIEARLAVFDILKLIEKQNKCNYKILEVK